MYMYALVKEARRFLQRYQFKTKVSITDNNEVLTSTPVGSGGVPRPLKRHVGRTANTSSDDISDTLRGSDGSTSLYNYYIINRLTKYMST